MDELDNYRPNYASTHRPKLPVRNPNYGSTHSSHFHDDDELIDDVGAEADEQQQDDDDDEEEEEDIEEDEVDAEEDDDQDNGLEQRLEGVEARVDDRIDNVAEDEDDEEEDDGYQREDVKEEKMGSGTGEVRKRKRRKLKSVNLGYELAPRVGVGSGLGLAAVAPKPPPLSGRNSPADWTEQATFVLLDTWGDKFVQLGRKSLRSDEWHEVAKQVALASRCSRTDTQCRNRLDTLKKKYKKEKLRLSELGGGDDSGAGGGSKWVYYEKMDMLMTSSLPTQQKGLSCGVDSGEFVFSNPKAYLSNSNVVDEMRDSPGNSESSDGDGDEDQSDGLPPKKVKPRENGAGVSNGGTGNSGGGGDKSSLRCLTESIEKFGQIYEKIENKKRDQIAELEKMRMDFYRELEIKKMQIMEQAHAEMAKIRRGSDNDDELDGSAENMTD